MMTVHNPCFSVHLLKRLTFLITMNLLSCKNPMEICHIIIYSMSNIEYNIIFIHLILEKINTRMIIVLSINSYVFKHFCSIKSNSSCPSSFLMLLIANNCCR